CSRFALQRPRTRSNASYRVHLIQIGPLVERMRSASSAGSAKEVAPTQRHARQGLRCEEPPRERDPTITRVDLDRGHSPIQEQRGPRQATTARNGHELATRVEAS